MTRVNYEVEFPGTTAEDVLRVASEEEARLPFVVEWSDITIHRFWDGPSDLVSSAAGDENMLQALREKEWEWIATLKARGHTP